MCVEIKVEQKDVKQNTRLAKRSMQMINRSKTYVDFDTKFLTFTTISNKHVHVEKFR